MGFKMPDLAKKEVIKKYQFNQKAPNHRIARKGLCLEGKCTNKDCEVFGKMVIMPMGYATFDF